MGKVYKFTYWPADAGTNDITMMQLRQVQACAEIVNFLRVELMNQTNPYSVTAQRIRELLLENQRTFALRYAQITGPRSQMRGYRYELVFENNVAYAVPTYLGKVPQDKAVHVLQDGRQGYEIAVGDEYAYVVPAKTENKIYVYPMEWHVHLVMAHGTPVHLAGAFKRVHKDQYHYNLDSGGYQCSRYVAERNGSVFPDNCVHQAIESDQTEDFTPACLVRSVSERLLVAERHDTEARTRFSSVYQQIANHQEEVVMMVGEDEQEIIASVPGSSSNSSNASRINSRAQSAKHSRATSPSFSALFGNALLGVETPMDMESLRASLERRLTNVVSAQSHVTAHEAETEVQVDVDWTQLSVFADMDHNVLRMAEVISNETADHKYAMLPEEQETMHAEAAEMMAEYRESLLQALRVEQRREMAAEYEAELATWAATAGHQARAGQWQALVAFGDVAVAEEAEQPVVGSASPVWDMAGEEEARQAMAAQYRAELAEWSHTVAHQTRAGQAHAMAAFGVFRFDNAQEADAKVVKPTPRRPSVG